MRGKAYVSLVASAFSYVFFVRLAVSGWQGSHAISDEQSK